MHSAHIDSSSASRRRFDAYTFGHPANATTNRYNTTGSSMLVYSKVLYFWGLPQSVGGLSKVLKP